MLLVCSAGASSGFMAQSIRKAARLENVEIEIEAKSDAMLKTLIATKDLLLVAPHLKFEEGMINGLAADAHIPYVFLTNDMYGSLDGASALKLGLATYQQFQEENK